MSKYVPIKLTQLSANESAAVDAINRNLESIEAHINDSVSRSAKTPSQMTADLDMNGKKIINIGAPVNPTDLVRQQDVVADKEEIKQMHDEVMATGERILSAAEVTDEKVQEASTYAALSQAWATKTDGTVDGSEYSSKHYAEQAREYFEPVAAITDEVETVAGIASDVTDVASIKNEVSEVSRISSDVSAAASNETNITAVASDIADVNAVATNISSVSAVAANESNINAVNSNKTNIDAVAENASNINTVAGNNANITTVAGISSDVATVATNISCVTTCASNITEINNASSYAAQAKQWAIGDPSEPSSGSAKYWADRAHVYTEGVLHEDLISNCILEIPQDIKLELNNGTLTLKAGSIFTMPDGTQLQTTSDQTWTSSTFSSKKLFIYVTRYGNSVGLYGRCLVSATSSGSSLPATVPGFGAFYNTSDNTIYVANSGAWEATTQCLPLAIVSTDADGNIASIDKVFNGAGYIGHHAFVLPGVKGLCPNGFNEDGTLKSTQFSISSLLISEMSSYTGNNTKAICIGNNSASSVTVSPQGFDDYPENPDSYVDYYVKKINKIVTWTGSAWSQRFRINFVLYTYSGGSVTRFDICPVYRVVTEEMLKEAQQVVTANKALVSDSNGKVSASSVTDTELGYLSGVTGNLQEQLLSCSTTPKDKTELKDGGGSLISSNGYLQLSESWQNFEELVFIAGSTSGLDKITAFRISTYWLDQLLNTTGSATIWSNYGSAYLSASNYNATSPSTTSDLYVDGHSYCYLTKVYGVNRKSS